MRGRTWPAAGALLLACLAGRAAGVEAETAAKGRELLAKHKDAVVTLKVVLATRYVMMGRQSNKRERKSEVPATVIAPSGLTVASYRMVDPVSVRADSSADMGGEAGRYRSESDVTDLKIVLADGTEVPAQIVLKDKDLDLVFLRPKEKPEKPFACIAFAKPAAEPEVLDEVISVGRMGRVLKRANSVTSGSLCAILKKPRTFYISRELQGLGLPVFNAKGETVGLVVMRMSRGAKPWDWSQMPVILPAEDVLESAQEAEKVQPKKEDRKDEAGEEKK